MCGRYQFSMEESAELREIVRQIGQGQNGWHTGEIYPTNRVPVLVTAQEQTAPALLGWGFPGFQGSKSIINARAETAAERPMFRKSLEGRRCAVPSSGFFEWDKDKQKYLFRLPDKNTLYMAGLWNEFAGKRRFCIVTTAANASISDIHSRMPVVLPKAQVQDWIWDRGAAEAILHTTPPMLVGQRVSAQTHLW